MIKEFIKPLDKFDHERMRVKLITDKGKLQSVLFQYESLINGKWIEIIRYDCFHGFFHRDVIWPNGEREKFEISISDLKTAAEYAEQDIKDRWEWYKERFLKKFKK